MTASDSQSADRPPRYEIEARVIAHEHVLANEYEIVFAAPEIAKAARPGQFLELLPHAGPEPLLRRPFSIYRVDREAGTCSVLYLARGAFTSGLVQKRVGDTLSVLGPLGRPFAWNRDPQARHLLIAGGIGAPPLYFLANEICREQAECGEKPSGVIVINAARTQDLLVGMTEFGALNVILHAVTNDGSHGRQGVATELLIELLDALDRNTPTFLYTCGPTPMLRAVSDIALARRLPCQISVETAMPCGIGTCYGCAIAVRDPAAPEGFSYARACWDGPVFEADTLVW